MSSARDQILGAVRRSLKADGADGARLDAVTARLNQHARNLVPARSQRDPAGMVELFIAQAEAVAATVERVPAAQVPETVRAYLTRNNLPARVRLAPDPALLSLPWDRQPLLEVETGRAEPEDGASVTGALAGIAETGTLLLASGEHGPTTLNFLPDTHMVVLPASRILGAYEDAWDQVRATFGDGRMPRTVNLITGPSRTADIEQTIQLGAHGPRRLHIILVEDEAAAEA